MCNIDIEQTAKRSTKSDEIFGAPPPRLPACSNKNKLIMGSIYTYVFFYKQPVYKQLALGCILLSNFQGSTPFTKQQ